MSRGIFRKWEGKKIQKFIRLDRVVQDNGAGEIYLFSIDNDGIDFEIDYEILSRSREIVKVPLIYGGGINNIEKIKKLIDIGFDGITISTAIYDKSLDLIDIKKNYQKFIKKLILIRMINIIKKDKIGIIPYGSGNIGTLIKTVKNFDKEIILIKIKEILINVIK